MVGWTRLGQSIKGAVKQLAVGIYRHDCLGLAAQLAYYGLFSLFPFLLFLRALLSYIPAVQRLVDQFLENLATVIDTENRLYEIIETNILEQLHAQSSALLSLGIILTIWAASTAFATLIKAVNLAYGVPETRPYHRRRFLAVLLTFGAAVSIPAGVVLVVAGPWLERLMAEVTGTSSLAHLLILVFRWPVIVLFLAAGMGFIYFLAPSITQRWYEAVPGSLFAILSVIGASLGFSWFISQPIYEIKWLSYGAIGTVMVLLLWMYIVGLLVLVGGEINAAVAVAAGWRRREAAGAQEPPAAPADEATGG